jgi:hypothetical protein
VIRGGSRHDRIRQAWARACAALRAPCNLVDDIAEPKDPAREPPAIVTGLTARMERFAAEHRAAVPQAAKVTPGN